jgi:hypothetical protein
MHPYPICLHAIYRAFILSKRPFDFEHVSFKPETNHWRRSVHERTERPVHLGFPCHGVPPLSLSAPRVYSRGVHIFRPICISAFFFVFSSNSFAETLTYITLLEFIGPVSAMLIQICIQPFNRLEVERKKGGETPWRLLAPPSPRRSSILWRQRRREGGEERIKCICPRRRRLGRRECVRPKSASVGCHPASLESAARSIEALLGRCSFSLYTIMIREKDAYLFSEI